MDTGIQHSTPFEHDLAHCLIKLLGAETKGGLSIVLLFCGVFFKNNGSKCQGESTMVFLRENGGVTELQTSKGMQRKSEAVVTATARS